MLISANVGSGHVRAAQAIHAALEKTCGYLEIVHLELLKHSSLLFRSAFNTFYGTLITRMPSLWRIIYERADGGAADGLVKRAGAALSKMNTLKLSRAIDEFDPDHIICTHFTPAELVAARRRKKKMRARLSVVITDYDIHNVWLHRGVDDYFVATRDMASAMPFRGINDSRIHSTGIPICSKFTPDAHNKRNLREQMGLEIDKPTILLTGGGCGLGGVEVQARALCENFPQAQFLAVAGNNHRLFTQLQGIAAASKSRLLPFGFVSNMHELMAASDVAITKSGGMTCSECLAMGLPMVIVNPIPGQEERNCDYLLECGAAMRAHSLAFLLSKVARFLTDADLRMQMSTSSRQLGKPTAAQMIAETILAGTAAVSRPTADESSTSHVSIAGAAIQTYP